MSTARRAKVEGAIKGIREFYALGRSLPPRRSHGEVYGEGINQKAGEREGVNPDTVGKARQFADRLNGYTPTEVKELFRLIRDTQPGQDEKLAVFSRTHVIRLLSVPKRSRGALQRQAIKKGWSTSELERQISARFGSRSSGGRPRRVPKDVLGQLVQVERMCDTWSRWVSAVENQREQHPSDFSEHLQELVDKATAALVALHHAVLKDMSGRRPKA